MIDPDKAALAARRLAAKMVADQGVHIMLSYVGQTGTDEISVSRNGTGIVVVARGIPAGLLIGFIESWGKPQSVEVEPVDR